MAKIICEIASPSLTWSEDRIQDWVSQTCALLKRQGVDTINLAEVIDEKREGSRCIEFVPKMDNIKFAEMLHQHLPRLVSILCKISTHVPKEQFAQWIRLAHQHGIRNIVVVGSMHQDLSGRSYTVAEAGHYIKEHFPDIKVGGIIIFSRAGEALRVVEKLENGIDFFLSQIIFETSNLKQVMLELKKHCSDKDILLPHVYVGLAPAAKRKDIEFLRWLGIEFPSAVLSYLTSSDDGVEERTFEVVERVLDEVIDFSHAMSIPLGFNIEHIMYGNLSLGERLISTVKSRMAYL